MPEVKVKSVKSNVQKIVIQAYTDNRFNKELKDLSFTVPINPEQLGQKFEIKHDQSTAAGNQGTSGKYSFTLPEELKLDFVLDNTNTITGNVHQGRPVADQVNELLKVVYVVHGPTHQPNFLKIGWNENPIFGIHRATFECRLKSLEINYVLFNREGVPLRAKVSSVFTAYIEDEKRVKQEDNQSPDLTHSITAAPSDRLWLMTQEIYNDPKYVTQVAQFNALDTFRDIEFGKPYKFPPFDKEETQ